MKDGINKIFSRRISVVHIFYWLLITVIINVFLLCIVPGKINDSAMDTISFTSAIVSIVLALVSIVYSMQSGFSTSSQMEGIKGIESNIKEELTKFQDLRDTITTSIDPIKKTVGDIQKTAGDLQKAQDDMKKNIDGLFNPITVKPSSSSGGSSKKDLNLNHIMVVTLYAAAKSKQTGMDIPFHIFASFVGPQAHYSEGMLEGWAALNDDIVLSEGSNSNRRKVIEYNESAYGSIEDLRSKAVSNSNTRLGRDFISAIDTYFSERKNQLAKDSVG